MPDKQPGDETLGWWPLDSDWATHERHTIGTPFQHWVVLEYCPGGSLEGALTQDQTFSLATAREFVLDILSGVQDLHSRGKVLRKLWPSKIYIDSSCLKIGGVEGILDLNTDTGGSEYRDSLDPNGWENLPERRVYLAPEVLDQQVRVSLGPLAEK